MLYDELVPDGKYLAHYGVPKDQWSAEARARHNRNHPNKTIDPGAVARSFRVMRDTYNEYQEDNYNRNYNRGGHRSFGSKVDEHRAEAAALSRQRDQAHRNGSDRGLESKKNDRFSNTRTPKIDEYRFQNTTGRQNGRRHSSESGAKPYSGQHVPDYRKPRGLSSKAPSTYAKPGRSGRSSGSGARMPLGGLRRDWDKPDSTFNNVKKPGPGTSGNYSSKALPSKGTPGKSRPNKDTPTAKETYTKDRPNKDTPTIKNRPNNKSTLGTKYSYGKKPSRSKTVHSGGGYSDRATNIYDRPNGYRTLHGGNAGPGSMEQLGANTYRRVDYESRRRRR